MEKITLFSDQDSALCIILGTMSLIVVSLFSIRAKDDYKARYILLEGLYDLCPRVDLEAICKANYSFLVDKMSGRIEYFYGYHLERWTCSQIGEHLYGLDWTVGNKRKKLLWGILASSLASANRQKLVALSFQAGSGLYHERGKRLISSFLEAGVDGIIFFDQKQHKATKPRAKVIQLVPSEVEMNPSRN